MPTLADEEDVHETLKKLLRAPGAKLPASTLESKPLKSLSDQGCIVFLGADEANPEEVQLTDHGIYCATYWTGLDV